MDVRRWGPDNQTLPNMQCLLIGLRPMPAEREAVELRTKMWQQVTDIDGLPVQWVSFSTAQDEDRSPTLLLSLLTEATADNVIKVATELIAGEYSCELWGSAPAILPLKPCEGYEHLLIRSKSDLAPFEDWAYSTIKQWGLFVQNNLLTADEVEQLRHYVLQEIDNAESLLKLHRPRIKIGKDLMAFKEIASRGNERFDLLLEPSSLGCQFVYNFIIKRISHVLERIIGLVDKEVDCDVSVVYSKPGAPNQGWHADGDHQKGSNDAGWDEDGWKTRLSDPYALCLFIPLIDLDDNTGYTQFWPASHRNKGLMGFGPLAEIVDATWNGKCEAGQAIWYDYRLMHRGIRNSSCTLRPVLQVLVKHKWYIERRNYGDESIMSLETS
ncbi:hypothetical protein HJC23_007497 [Cyclotella cryptica]|uniref:Phytanoyl-CoA dioxygenase n=1 Tax=Cyclotella cryptica TaxID=29204 RepID=A0ABD3Q061_9STRA|eukprot:CCRYP_011393-RA/>CCRYP_011393-RA protein AED:0.00 eAED:0.00 QI:309/-1/1/1/-1/1/1/35/382